jgi:putative membrane protein
VSLGAIALLGSAWLPIEGSPVELFGLQLAALAIAHLACRLDAIRHAFVSERELQTKAEAAALHAFHEHGLRRTEGRTGILIFVALFEHRVVVLADEAIDQALGPDEQWETLVEAVLGGIRHGRAADGIIEAVEQCGALLAHPLPAAPDDRDEIPHGLVLVDE